MVVEGLLNLAGERDQGSNSPTTFFEDCGEGIWKLPSHDGNFIFILSY